MRAATELDIPAITNIYAHHVCHGTGTFEIDPPDVAEMARRWLDLTGRGFPYLVAEQDGSVVGYAYAGPYRAREAYRFTLEDSVYIHPEYMRRGIGRALLSELIEICCDKGFRQMIAVIGDSRNAGSIRVHEEAGFLHVGSLRAVGFKFGEWLDAVIMQRPLL